MKGIKKLEKYNQVEEILRKKYQREDETDIRGTNIEAIDKMIEMVHLHEKSEDERIGKLMEVFIYMDKIAPNFTIFEAENCIFMRNFKAYQISKNTDMMAALHEFGHAVLAMLNDTKVPENYGLIIEKAKKYALSSENKEYFKQYIQYLAGKTVDTEKRTEGEKGPVSDIISSIFQLKELRINTPDNVCKLPAKHEISYYYDENNKTPNLKNIFDEDFANYYALKASNCTQEIETIRALFGDELIETLDDELTKISRKLEMVKETPGYLPDIYERIKGIIVTTKQSEVQSVNSLEKIEERKKLKQDWR